MRTPSDYLFYEQRILANCTQLFPGKSAQVITAGTGSTVTFIVCAATGELLYESNNNMEAISYDLEGRLTSKIADIRAGRAIPSVRGSSELADMKTEVEKLRQEMEGLKRENAALAGRCGEAEGYKREIEGWKNEVAGWKREVEGWKAENEGLKRELAEARGGRFHTPPPQGLNTESVWSEDFGTPIATPCAASEAGDEDGCSPWLEVRAGDAAPVKM
jgi:hypothetical protein